MMKQIAANLELAFPLGGYCERKDIQKYYKVSANTWTKMRNEGRAPQVAHHYSSNKIFYKNGDVIEFLDNPDNYYAGGFEPKNQISKAAAQLINMYLETIAKTSKKELSI